MNVKSFNKENLNSSCNIVQVDEIASSVNTINIESISNRENSAKSLITLTSSIETSSVDENGKKHHMIISETSTLNSNLLYEITPCK